MVLFLLQPLLPIHLRYTGWFVHLISTHTHTPSLCMTPPGGETACRRGFYMHNTQSAQETDINFPDSIRTRNPSTKAAAGLCLRTRGHRNLLTARPCLGSCPVDSNNFFIRTIYAAKHECKNLLYFKAIVKPARHARVQPLPLRFAYRYRVTSDLLSPPPPTK